MCGDQQRVTIRGEFQQMDTHERRVGQIERVGCFLCGEIGIRGVRIGSARQIQYLQVHLARRLPYLTAAILGKAHGQHIVPLHNRIDGTL